MVLAAAGVAAVLERARGAQAGAGVIAGFGRRLALIAVAALGIRLLYALVLVRDAPLLGDALQFHLQANYLADGLGYVQPFLLRDTGVAAGERRQAAAVPVPGGRRVAARRPLVGLAPPRRGARGHGHGRRLRPARAQGRRAGGRARRGRARRRLPGAGGHGRLAAQRVRLRAGDRARAARRAAAARRAVGGPGGAARRRGRRRGARPQRGARPARAARAAAGRPAAHGDRRASRARSC